MLNIKSNFVSVTLTVSRGIKKNTLQVEVYKVSKVKVLHTLFLLYSYLVTCCEGIISNLLVHIRN